MQTSGHRRSFEAMSPPESIRLARPDDADALSALGARTFSDTYAAFNTAENMTAHIAGTFSPELQRAEIAYAEGFILVAATDTLIAYAQVTRGLVPPDVGDMRAMEIKRFYVDRVWHGSGVAQRLMAETVRNAAARGAATVWLSVWSQNPRAIAFYRKAGFIDVGTYPFRLGNDMQTDILMTRGTAL
jgi:diamine N-acetyltransferase